MSTIIQKRAQNYQKTAKILGALAVIIALIGGYFAYQQFSEFRTLKGYIKANSTLTTSLDTSFTTEDSKYKALNSNYRKLIVSRDQKIDSILPTDESLTELTRLLEQFFIDNNFPNNPVTLSSLSFANSDETEKYMTLSFTMNLTGTEANFFKLLDFIKDSGNLNTPYRLMAITKVNMVFPQVSEEEDATLEESDTPAVEELNYSIEGVAYFQKQLTSE